MAKKPVINQGTNQAELSADIAAIKERAELLKLPAQSDEETKLLLAAKHGYLRDVEHLLLAHVNVNTRNTALFNIVRGATALMLAAERGHNAVCSCLIRAGADIEARDLDGTKPLMSAAYNGQLETVKLLIAHGAVMDSIDNKGDTALSYAVANHSWDCAVELVRQGANWTQSCSAGCHRHAGMNVMVAAVSCNKWNVVRQLLKLGVSPSYRDTNGRIAYAYAGGCPSDIARELLAPVRNRDYGIKLTQPCLFCRRQASGQTYRIYLARQLSENWEGGRGYLVQKKSFGISGAKDEFVCDKCADRRGRAPRIRALTIAFVVFASLGSFAFFYLDAFVGLLLLAAYLVFVYYSNYATHTSRGNVVGDRFLPDRETAIERSIARYYKEHDMFADDSFALSCHEYAREFTTQHHE